MLASMRVGGGALHESQPESRQAAAALGKLGATLGWGEARALGGADAHAAAATELLAATGRHPAQDKEALMAMVRSLESQLASTHASAPASIVEVAAAAAERRDIDANAEVACAIAVAPVAPPAADAAAVDGAAGQVHVHMHAQPAAAAHPHETGQTGDDAAGSPFAPLRHALAASATQALNEARRVRLSVLDLSTPAGGSAEDGVPGPASDGRAGDRGSVKRGAADASSLPSAAAAAASTGAPIPSTADSGACSEAVAAARRAGLRQAMAMEQRHGLLAAEKLILAELEDIEMQLAQSPTEEVLACATRRPPPAARHAPPATRR